MQERATRQILAGRRLHLFMGLLFALTLGLGACSDSTEGTDGWDLETEGFGDPDIGVDEEDSVDGDGVRCIEVIPEDEINFGRSTIGELIRKTVLIRNCSPHAPLSLREIWLTDDGGGVFKLDPASMSENPTTLSAGERANFVLTFSPSDARAYRGSVQIRSDAASPRIELPLVGEGTQDACPTAAVIARIVGDPTSQPGTEIEAQPLDTIKFDASASSAPAGRSVARYEWTILSSPSASSERLTPAGSQTPTLFLDTNGEYKVELTVYDDENTVSCGQPAVITILASSGEDIHIQLTWATQNQLRNHDVDLHYLHPNSNRWAHEAGIWDCYYNNQTPDWNVPGGSPVLDIDDLTGPGPENISHSNLEPLTYRVGVHYYSDHGNGPAFATVEIRRDGLLVFSARDKRLTDEQFWEVASIDGRTGAVRETGTVTPTFPER